MHVPRLAAGPALTSLAALAALASTACGGPPPPTRAQTDAVASVRAAETVGAEQSPTAALHLQLAREQLEVAEALIDEGKMEDASRVLIRAKADADLAIALANESRAREDAEETRSTMESLERGLE